MFPRDDAGTSRSNPYRAQIDAVLPRLLSLFDVNPISPTLGLGDRFHWAWKLIDFGNGTFQGAAHGLARLMVNDLLPAFVAPSAALRRIDAMFEAADRLRRPNGSFEEAFPHENSFCVTALVAFDLLSAIDLLRLVWSPNQRDRGLAIVAPMIRFLERSDETHAFISNHLATAAAAHFHWARQTGGTTSIHGRRLLDRILAAQSSEGWYREYEGADPGYQTLCLHYLADIHQHHPELDLQSSLGRSLAFLWHFLHPDGSFGGVYGSRNTRFVYPGGIEHLADQIPEARALARATRDSIADHRVVTLDAMDAPNLIPMFNSYCWAATQSLADTPDEPALPARRAEPFRIRFPQAGLVIDGGPRHYTIVATHKGGVVYHFDKTSGRRHVDSGVVARSPRGRLFSNQSHDAGNRADLDRDVLVIDSPMSEVRGRLPTPLDFVILRILNLTLMRNGLFSRWIKKALVRLLITGKTLARCRNRRVVRLGAGLAIEDRFEENADRLEPVPTAGEFGVIHMASQGYWQRTDDQE